MERVKDEVIIDNYMNDNSSMPIVSNGKEIDVRIPDLKN